MRRVCGLFLGYLLKYWMPPLLNQAAVGNDQTEAQISKDQFSMKDIPGGGWGRN